ncbi:MAG: hypothetical protein FWE23_01805 [Chitinivibrionia bacterium]|nr:hypothetical protein [Chitinivibrionia bacterium]
MKPLNFLKVFATILIIASTATAMCAPSFIDWSAPTITISNECELREFATTVSSGSNFTGQTITLVADIDLILGEWEPIGSQNDRFIGNFDGTFDGGGHIVRGVRINRPNAGDGPAGFFHQLNNNGIIKNLGVIVNIDGWSGVGGLVGTNRGTIQNTFVRGSVAGHAQNSVVGGFAGWNNGEIINSYFEGNVSGGNPNIAGKFVGANHGTSDGRIISSYALQCSRVFVGLWTQQGTGEICQNSGLRNATQMRQRNTFIDWDFNSIWSISPAINDGFPHFSPQIVVCDPPFCMDVIVEARVIIENGEHGKVMLYSHIDWCWEKYVVDEITASDTTLWGPNSCHWWELTITPNAGYIAIVNGARWEGGKIRAGNPTEIRFVPAIDCILIACYRPYKYNSVINIQNGEHGKVELAYFDEIFCMNVRKEIADGYLVSYMGCFHRNLFITPNNGYVAYVNGVRFTDEMYPVPDIGFFGGLEQPVNIVFVQDISDCVPPLCAAVIVEAQITIENGEHGTVMLYSHEEWCWEKYELSKITASDTTLWGSSSCYWWELEITPNAGYIALVNGVHWQGNRFVVPTNMISNNPITEIRFERAHTILWGNWIITPATCDEDGDSTRFALNDPTIKQVRIIPRLDCPRYGGILLDTAVVSRPATITVVAHEALTDVRMVIFNSVGNMVFETTDFTRPTEKTTTAEEELTTQWNLTNPSGRRVASGGYLVVVRARGESGYTYTYRATIGVRR